MMHRREFLCALTAAATVGRSLLAAESNKRATRVLIVAGPSKHPPGTHEVAAGARLMKHCLEHAANLPGVQADVVQGWPADETLLGQASTVVFIGDLFPLQRLPDTAANLARLSAMMARGCGITCVHYATGLGADDVGVDGDHPLLRWLGGYFATKCAHHQSVAKVYAAATITPAAPEHPVWRGCREFTLHDEPYIENYFGPDGNRMAANVTALSTSMLPPDAPRRETVAWGVERPDGGRGFGIVMPHFYRNWALEDLRRHILNGIVWTAKREVPEGGVKTPPPDLASFGPEAVEPRSG